jgi:2-hydroxychromene-2-carboxylate isomerase
VNADAAFYFDLASPLAYLAAEQVLHALPGPAEWRPVLARELAGEHGGGDRADEAWRCEHEREAFREDVARGAERLGLQPLRWPATFPFDSEPAMRVATYAKSIGRAVPFAQAAFRQAFAGGRDLGELDSVLIAAAACEMHPAAVTRAVQLESVVSRLAAATGEAARLGVVEVPAILVGEQLFAGERAVQRAAAQMLELAGAAP